MNLYEDIGRRYSQDPGASAYNTLVVNLFGGPGAGKSTLAHRLCADLAMKGRLVEYAPEYAKELIWEDRQELLSGAVTARVCIVAEQIGRLNSLRGKVEVAVTDSPILLALSYTDRDDRDYGSFAESLAEYHRSCRRLNVFVNRSPVYDPRGRRHTLDESIALDADIRSVLEETGDDAFEYFRNDGEAPNYPALLDMVLEQAAK